jgi:hypothetical protein
MGTIKNMTEIKEIKTRPILDIEADDPRQIGLSK